MNLRPIENELIRIIERLSENLPDDQIQDMLDMAKSGEPGIAFENLCTQLHEYDVRIDRESFESLTQIGQLMDIDACYWEQLDSLHT